MDRKGTVPATEFWTDLLNLNGFEVVDHQHDPTAKLWRLTVAPRIAIGVCPDCGRSSQVTHQTRSRERIHDLPIGQSRVELTVRCLQFLCEGCRRCFTPPSPALAEGTHATQRFLEHAARLIRTTDIANAAEFFGIPEKTLEAWYYKYLEQSQALAAAVAEPIRSIGIDELSLKKGDAASSR